MILLEPVTGQTSREVEFVFTTKASSPETNINFLCEYPTKELNIKNKLCVLVALHQPPSQSHNEFSSFITNLESILHAITLRKPFLTMGDFNAK